MRGYLGENIRQDLAILSLGGATAPGESTLNSTVGVNSKCFSLKDVDKVMVLCGIGPSTGTSSVQATFAVVVGTYAAGGGSALTALANATLSLGGLSSKGIFANITELSVHCDATGALTDADTFAIDGATFTVNTAGGTVSDKTLSTGNVAYMNDFVSAIATWATHVEVGHIVTATTDTRCIIRPKDYGFAGPMTSGMGVTATTNATTAEVELLPLKHEGCIEFTPGDVLATAASYTHFAVRLVTSATTVPMTAMVIRTGGMQATNTKRIQV